MAKRFEYEFEIVETVYRRCDVVVAAETLEEAMSLIEEHGPWDVGNEPYYGKDLYYECEESLDNDPRNPENWIALDPIEEDD